MYTKKDCVDTIMGLFIVNMIRLKGLTIKSGGITVKKYENMSNTILVQTENKIFETFLWQTKINDIS